MGIFDKIKEIITDKPANLSGPRYIKAFKNTNEHFERLDELSKSSPPKLAEIIDKDVELLKLGFIGEGHIAYELEHSRMPILILHDIYIEFNNKTAQIDFLVIANNFILVIESKNMVGDIKITNTGEFIRQFKSGRGNVYKEEGMYSPIVQNERHVALLKEVLEHYGVKKASNMLCHIVVVTNPKSIIKSSRAPYEVKKYIIKHDQLIKTLSKISKEKADSKKLFEAEMYKVAEIIMKHNKSYSPDYKNIYENKLKNIMKKNNNITYENATAKKKTQLSTENSTKSLKDSVIRNQDEGLYEALKEYRINKSKAERIKAFWIYKNDELSDLIKYKPKTLSELEKIKGFGEVKCKKYGTEIINIIKEYT